MASNTSEMNMDQKIFTVGLSVQAVSAYLLCCSLADLNTPITLTQLTQMWNEDQKGLINSLSLLENHNIIQKRPSPELNPEINPELNLESNLETSEKIYQLNPSKFWK